MLKTVVLRTRQNARRLRRGIRRRRRDGGAVDDDDEVEWVDDDVEILVVFDGPLGAAKAAEWATVTNVVLSRAIVETIQELRRRGDDVDADALADLDDSVRKDNESWEALRRRLAATAPGQELQAFDEKIRAVF